MPKSRHRPNRPQPPRKQASPSVPDFLGNEDEPLRKPRSRIQTYGALAIVLLLAFSLMIGVVTPFFMR